MSGHLILHFRTTLVDGPSPTKALILHCTTTTQHTGIYQLSLRVFYCHGSFWTFLFVSGNFPQNVVQHAAKHCNTLQHTAIDCDTIKGNQALVSATRCTTLHHTAPHCNTLQYTATLTNPANCGPPPNKQTYARTSHPHTYYTPTHVLILAHCLTRHANDSRHS